MLREFIPPSRAAQAAQARKMGGGARVADREDSMRVLAAMFNHMLGSQNDGEEEEEEEAMEDALPEPQPAAGA